VTGLAILRRGHPAAHRIARADRFWRRAVGLYGLALFAATCVIQMAGAR
jgi:hypothetical protein